MYKQNYILLFIYSQKDMEIQSNWNNLVPQCKTLHKLEETFPSPGHFFLKLSYLTGEGRNESFWLSQFLVREIKSCVQHSVAKGNKF